MAFKKGENIENKKTLWKITYLKIESDKKKKQSQLMVQEEIYIATKILDKSDLERHLNKWAKDFGVIKRLIKLEELGTVFIL